MASVCVWFGHESYVALGTSLEVSGLNLQTARDFLVTFWFSKQPNNLSNWLTITLKFLAIHHSQTVLTFSVA